MAIDLGPLPGGSYLDREQLDRFQQWIRDLDAEDLLTGDGAWEMTPADLVRWLGIGFEAGWSRGPVKLGRRLPARHLQLVQRVGAVLRQVAAKTRVQTTTSHQGGTHEDLPS